MGRSVMEGVDEGSWSVFAEKVVQQRDEAREEIQRLKIAARMYRARLVEVMPWVGVCPYPNTTGFQEMLAVKGLAEDALKEEKP